MFYHLCHLAEFVLINIVFKISFISMTKIRDQARLGLVVYDFEPEIMLNICLTLHNM